MRRFVIPCFCAGLVAGIFIMNIGKSIFLENTGFFDAYTLCQIKVMTVDRNALFYYVFRKRILKLLAMAVLSTTYLGLAFCIGAALWYGMSAGLFLSALLLRYGLKGIFLAVVCLLPQYLLYVPALLIFVRWADEVYYGIYSRSGNAIGAKNKGFLLKKSGQLTTIIGLYVIGCLLEGYLNPVLLLSFLKIF